ncbi:hypothetical protein [Gramella sp. KN1008]|uniref:hypothetical protein n=1 Tax=Gramella sp. KN1008 TaxID=2529298 RepID=UPI0010387069|nr:hypothetical protein [Gramella sp. KN1008]TBW27089.1 hypothetical protein EZJ28_12300 [Gramella sp. KN1008]
MKLFSSLAIGVIILFSTSCGSGNTSEGEQYSGTIEPAGITSYQYGTHRLETTDNFYALKSDIVDLGQYEGQKVSITATKIEGYPVDGGPVYLNVTKVKSN